jgi:hypothetical protein
MKFLFYASIVLLLLAGFAIGQEKGIDPQTKTIKKAAGPTNRGGTVSKGINFGAGKTKPRIRISNPYRIRSRRDVLIRTISNILSDEKFIIDETASRFTDGVIVTQPRIFSRGPILTKNELNRYAIIPSTDQVWTRGRFTLTIDIVSIDGIRNDVSVNATIEGRSENGIFSEWSTLDSAGVAEEEFLRKVVEYYGPVETVKPKTK